MVALPLVTLKLCNLLEAVVGVVAVVARRVGFTDRFCPSNTSAFGLWCDRARSEEGYKMSLQQIRISERAHKKSVGICINLPSAQGLRCPFE